MYTHGISCSYSQYDSDKLMMVNCGLIWSKAIVSFSAQRSYCAGVLQRNVMEWVYYESVRLHLGLLNVSCTWHALSLQTTCVLCPSSRAVSSLNP